MKNFSQIKAEYDSKYKGAKEVKAIVPVHLTLDKKCGVVKKNGTQNEEYYKWQMIYSLVYSGLVPKEYMGTEIHFPKGNKNSAEIKIDICVFDDIDWFKKYKEYHENKNLDSLQWLRDHLIMPIEIKKEDSKDIITVWDKQLKAYMKESEREFCVGALYDTGRLYLFKNKNSKYIRLNDQYNEKGDNSKSKELSLQLPDTYKDIPSLKNLMNWNGLKKIDRSNRNIEDLDIISGVHSQQVNNAMSNILRTMDKHGMVNQKGYDILLQILALKIYDEKRNEKYKDKLKFYIEDDVFSSLSDISLQKFLNRIGELRDSAKKDYYRILDSWYFNKKDANHVKVLIEIVSQFQDYSFVLSTKTDLYQLVFYTFAS